MNPTYEFATRPAVSRRLSPVLASSRKHTRERKRRLKIRKKGERKNQQTKKEPNMERGKHLICQSFMKASQA
jgi:hypothetical protein